MALTLLIPIGATIGYFYNKWAERAPNPAFAERLGGPDGQQRLAERIALWQQFCNFHHAPATIVNLLDPAKRPIDADAAPIVSAAR